MNTQSTPQHASEGRTTAADQPRAAGEAAHTATPWRVEERMDGGSLLVIRVLGHSKPDFTAECLAIFCVQAHFVEEVKKARANAAFIVRACNEYAELKAKAHSHAALVEALAGSTDMLLMVAELLRDGPHYAKAQFLDEQVAANRAALALVKDPH